MGAEKGHPNGLKVASGNSVLLIAVLLFYSQRTGICQSVYNRCMYIYIYVYGHYDTFMYYIHV